MENLIKVQKYKESARRFAMAAILIVATTIVLALRQCVPQQTRKPIPQPLISSVISDVKPKKAAEKKANFFAKVEKLDTNVAHVKAYILRFQNIAILEQEKFGIPASVTLAQGILESKSGRSSLAVKNNNHFGIKCFSILCKKGHCDNFSDDTHKDFFIKYSSAWSSYRDHSTLLKRWHYRSLFKKKGYVAWCNELQRLGYATDKTYAEYLIYIIKKYNLNKLDTK